MAALLSITAIIAVVVRVGNSIYREGFTFMCYSALLVHGAENAEDPYFRIFNMPSDRKHDPICRNRDESAMGREEWGDERTFLRSTRYVDLNPAVWGVVDTIFHSQVELNKREM